MSEQVPREKPAEKTVLTPAKKKKNETPIYKLYEVKGTSVNRLRKECPRCGKGTFLAEHKDRLTCGKCGYTSYKKPVQR